MSTFKKFTDCALGFALFSAVMYLFTQYMDYPFADGMSLLEKLRFFFSSQSTRDFRPYLLLMGLMVLSLTVSILLRRFPVAVTLFSALPFLRVISMLGEKNLFDRPLLYVILCGLCLVGALYDCLARDREDGGRRLAWASDSLALLLFGLCGTILLRLRFLPDLPPEEMTFFDRNLLIAKELSSSDFSVYWTLLGLFAALVLLRLFWRELYFLDVLLALAPCGYTFYAWYTGTLCAEGTVLASLALLFLLSRVTLMLFVSPRDASCPKDDKPQ